MLVVKGESILLIMPSRFTVVLPFMVFLTSSNSFLIFFIIWSLPRVDYAMCSKVSLLLFLGLWASSSLLLWLRWDCNVLVPSGCAFCFFKSSFYFINSCTLAINAWTCSAITTRSDGAVVVGSIGSVELNQQWIQQLMVDSHKRHQTDEARLRLVSMFLVSTMDDLEILCKRKH